MTRHFENWLSAYVDYAGYSEAPKHMHFWVGVSAIAGALRRRVWIDQIYFKWFPNFYICLVAPPGIVSKSTTAGIGMSILRSVPDIRFGPDVVTWPALVSAFAESAMTFEYDGLYHPMCAMTLESSEFGNLLNPSDKEMVDLLVSLWDGKQGTFEKKTKHSGNDSIINPWINIVACTTPAWIAGSFPEYMIGGGLTSRMLFVYAERKAKYIAYPYRSVPRDMEQTKQMLVDDLTHISQRIVGPYRLTEDAIAWGEKWYQEHYESRHEHLDQDRFGGYIARKQTHVHKLAIILAAAESDKMDITATHLKLANEMVTDLEPDMQFVFSKIGKVEDAVYADRLVEMVLKRGQMPWPEAYRYVHQYFPKIQDFEAMLTGLVRSEQIALKQIGGTFVLFPGNGALRSFRAAIENRED